MLFTTMYTKTTTFVIFRKSIARIALGVLCFYSVADAGQLLYTADFETDIKPIDRTSDSYAPLRSSGNPPEIVAAENGVIPRRGSHMMKTYLNRFTSGVNYRTEAVAASFQDFNGEFKKGQAYWLGVSVFLPADWNMDYGGTSNGNPVEERLAGGIVLQFHDRGYLDETWRYGLPMVVRHTKNGFQISNRASGCGSRPGCNEGTPLRQFKADNIPMKLGQWNDFVMHLKFTSDADGFIRIWVNGNLELDEKGRNYYEEHTRYPFFKMGLYQSQYKFSGWSENIVWNVNERTLYHDELRIGGAQSSYDEVAPGLTQPPKPNKPNLGLGFIPSLLLLLD